ncbi:class I SAM-dependent methyltransferase, partial [Streptomyces boncukensis]
LVDRIVRAAPGPGPAPDLLDVGCGTGIAARQFRAAGRTVLGVDPDARLAAFARRAGVAVEVAAFEDWDPDGREFDAVVSGQAWHWVDPVAGAAQAARVLRPGGPLAAFWHVFQPPAEVADALAAAYRQVAPDSPFAAPLGRKATESYDVLLTRAADGIREAGGFREPEEWRFAWERDYTRDAWLDQMRTHGSLTRLPEDSTARVLEAVGSAIDGLGGGFTMPYTTVALTALRGSW